MDSMALGDFSQATIRDIQALSRLLEEKTGQPVIHLEMGVPGLQPSEIALKAEKEALENGCATSYPPNGGIPRIKKAASEFCKAFIGVDIDPLCCIPTTGSMQGTFATFLAIKHACAGTKKDTVLFIQPGFPVQTTQCDVIGLNHTGLDIHDFRGNALIEKLDEIMAEGNICCIVYSNPNNPSWVCFTEEELKGIGALADKHDILVLEDLAYFAMDFRRDLSHPYEAPYQATVAKYTDNYVLWYTGKKKGEKPYAGEYPGDPCVFPGFPGGQSGAVAGDHAVAQIEGKWFLLFPSPKPLLAGDGLPAGRAPSPHAGGKAAAGPAPPHRPVGCAAQL